MEGGAVCSICLNICTATPRFHTSIRHWKSRTKSENCRGPESAILNCNCMGAILTIPVLKSINSLSRKGLFKAYLALLLSYRGLSNCRKGYRITVVVLILTYCYCRCQQRKSLFSTEPIAAITA